MTTEPSRRKQERRGEGRGPALSSNLPQRAGHRPAQHTPGQRAQRAPTDGQQPHQPPGPARARPLPVPDPAGSQLPREQTVDPTPQDLATMAAYREL